MASVITWIGSCCSEIDTFCPCVVGSAKHPNVRIKEAGISRPKQVPRFSYNSKLGLGLCSDHGLASWLLSLQYPCPAYQPQIDAGIESTLLSKPYSGPCVGSVPTPIEARDACPRRVGLGPTHRRQSIAQLNISRKIDSCKTLNIFNDICYVCWRQPWAKPWDSGYLSKNSLSVGWCGLGMMFTWAEFKILGL